MSDFELYTYQKEVVERALQGENIIIWLPTGGGKTRTAVYVAKKHLETAKRAKVVVLVNKVHLVDQHYNKEFHPYLSPLNYKVVPVSGDSSEKDFFGKVVEASDVIICTAQILYNALINTEDTKHVELSDITLLVIDECHHTNKESVYNKIMRCYLEKKLKGQRPLPQILGLTASPGTGGAKILDRAVEHVLQVRLYVFVLYFSHISLSDRVRQMKCKSNISRKLKLCVFLGSGVKDDNRCLAQCALHLRQYNDALLINDTLRMMDAYDSLKEFYDKISTKAIDGTDLFLLGLFQENQVELKKLAGDSRYENPKMGRLESVLLNQFGQGVKSRGIVFSKTRRSTKSLSDWVRSNRTLQGAGIKAAIFTGAGSGSFYMTLNEQSETIRNFRKGTLNLLIATSVAEEGFDIPECNLVVRYGLLTNEIAQQQASGRARAANSQYSVVAMKGGREERREITNEYLEELTGKAIAKVQDLSPVEFQKKIIQLQEQAVISSKVLEGLKIEKRGRYSASSIRLLCRNCFTPVASGSDIKLVDNAHYVNINPDFKRHFKVGGQVRLPRSFEDWEPGRTISCNYGNCNRDWGYEMKYKKIALLPNLAIKNLALETPDGRVTVKKWKGIPFSVEDFSFQEYCKNNYPDLLD
uniref:RNA helicase n=1 Tax=Echeneis naucrates TaxID=173247 RepID=A0A665SXF7_ECHNA